MHDSKGTLGMRLLVCSKSVRLDIEFMDDMFMTDTLMANMFVADIFVDRHVTGQYA